MQFLGYCGRPRYWPESTAWSKSLRESISVTRNPSQACQSALLIYFQKRHDVAYTSESILAEIGTTFTERYIYGRFLLSFECHLVSSSVEIVL